MTAATAHARSAERSPGGDVITHPAAALDAALRSAIARAFGEQFRGVDPLISPSRNVEFGDFQANVAMSLAKQLGQKPRDVAAKIVAAADLGAIAEAPDIAGPGFINIRLKNEVLGRFLEALDADPRHGVPIQADPVPVVIDYSSPNVAKEMHVGHLRSTIIGDTFARVLSFLYGPSHAERVIRQNHLGDWGTQFGRVMLGLWYEAVAMATGELGLLNGWIERAKLVPKKRSGETAQQAHDRDSAERKLLDEIVPWHIQHYLKDREGKTYFEPYLGQRFPDLVRLQTLYTFAASITEFDSAASYKIVTRDHGDTPLSKLPSLFATFVQRRDEQEEMAWRKSRETTLSACREIYSMLNITLTDAHIRGESEYQNQLQSVVDALLSAGIAEVNDGAVCVFVPGFADPEGKPTPMIIQKSDGGFGYATTDLAAIRYRVQKLKAERIIYVVDARQRDHFRAVFEVARMAGWDKTTEDRPAELKHVPFGAVLGEDRKPLKTRSGENVTLKSLLDEAVERGTAEVRKRADDPNAPTHGLSDAEIRDIGRVVGIGAVKYADLSNDLVRDYVFNLDRMVMFEGNTGPYMQYAHARICSIFAKAGGAGGAGEATAVATKEAKLLINEPAEKQLALALLRFGDVVQDVARSLEPHRLCTYLFELANTFNAFYQNCPVLIAEAPELRGSRLRLCDLTRRVLADGLDLLGIEAPRRM